MAYVEKNALLSKEKHICFGQITIIPKTEFGGIWVPYQSPPFGATNRRFGLYTLPEYACLYIYTLYIFRCKSIYIVMTYFKS